ncbi:putative aerotolerance protein BatD [Campylobacter blaseri]|nr:BatD family protein [Campylobacter blaseri]QKF85769.1 putative aerotolerance protein BatD [Campylobacter blaseri]
MKKLNLGSIILTIFLSINVFASAELRLNTPAINKGDLAQFTIIATGNDVKFPIIVDIDEFKVLSTSSSQSINTINRKTIKRFSRTYGFMPNRSVTIPEFEVIVDGRSYKTQKAEIKVVEPEASKDGDNHVFELKIDKTNLVLGDSTKLSFIIKSKIGRNPDRVRLDSLDIDGLLLRRVGDAKRYIDGNYTVEEVEFLLTPLKARTYKIPSIAAYIGTIVSADFFADLEWERVYSKSFKINVEPLPAGIANFGNFNIRTIVDKTKVKANEPVNLTLEIEGFGNIDDIDKFSLNFDGAMVYSDETDLKHGMKNDKYGGKFIQKFALISDRNYTIPSISFRYLDSKTNSVKTIKTDEIKIEVEVDPKSLSSNIETLDSSISKATTITKIEYKNNYLNILFGFMAGALCMFALLKFNFKRTPKEELPIEILIKRSKSDKELFGILLPYAKKDAYIDEILSKLEENIYKSATHNIDKKKLIERLERYFYLSSIK